MGEAEWGMIYLTVPELLVVLVAVLSIGVFVGVVVDSRLTRVHYEQLIRIMEIERKSQVRQAATHNFNLGARSVMSKKREDKDD